MLARRLAFVLTRRLSLYVCLRNVCACETFARRLSLHLCLRDTRGASVILVFSLEYFYGLLVLLLRASCTAHKLGKTGNGQLPGQRTTRGKPESKVESERTKTEKLATHPSKWTPLVATTFALRNMRPCKTFVLARRLSLRDDLRPTSAPSRRDPGSL